MARATDRPATAATDKPILSSGIGESRLFGGSTPHEGNERLLNCHIAGIRIADMPEEHQAVMLATFTYSQTDEGRAEADAEKRARGVTLVEHAARVTSRSGDRNRPDYNAENAPAQFRDGLDLTAETDNPLDALREPYQRPGMRLHWATPDAVRDGRHRDKVVVRGSDGDPVTYRNLTLMEYPEEIAARRKAKAHARIDFRREDAQAKVRAAVTDALTEARHGASETDQILSRINKIPDHIAAEGGSA